MSPGTAHAIHRAPSRRVTWPQRAWGAWGAWGATAASMVGHASRVGAGGGVRGRRDIEVAWARQVAAFPRDAGPGPSRPGRPLGLTRRKKPPPWRSHSGMWLATAQTSVTVKPSLMLALHSLFRVLTKSRNGPDIRGAGSSAQDTPYTPIGPYRWKIASICASTWSASAQAVVYACSGGVNRSHHCWKHSPIPDILSGTYLAKAHFHKEVGIFLSSLRVPSFPTRARRPTRDLTPRVGRTHTPPADCLKPQHHRRQCDPGRRQTGQAI